MSAHQLEVPEGPRTLCDALVAHATAFRAAQRVLPTWPLQSGEMCMADVSPVRVGESAAQLPCGHVFHSLCLMPYWRNSPAPRCPVDGSRVSSVLSSLRFCAVRNADAAHTPTGVRRLDVSHELDPLYWLCAELAAAERGRANGPVLQSFRIREDDLEHRRAIAERYLCDGRDRAPGSGEQKRMKIASRRSAEGEEDEPLPKRWAYRVGFTGGVECDLMRQEMWEGIPMITFKCGHDVCVRYAECAARGRPQGVDVLLCPVEECFEKEVPVGRRWTAPGREAALNINGARLGCAELAMTSVERSLPSESVEEIRRVMREGLLKRFRLLIGTEYRNGDFEAVESAITAIGEKRGSGVSDDGTADSGIQSSADRSPGPRSDPRSPADVPDPASIPLASVQGRDNRNSFFVNPTTSDQAVAYIQYIVRAGATAEEESGANDEDRMCAIDFEPLCTGDVLIRLPCMHVFHQECIVPYLKRMPQPKCPLDRAPINKAQIDEFPVWMKP